MIQAGKDFTKAEREFRKVNKKNANPMEVERAKRALEEAFMYFNKMMQIYRAHEMS
jgi:hypothetical protein